MSRFVEGCDRRQPTLLPECLDDYVAEENPVRVVDVFVGDLDLGALGFEGVRPAATGRPAYHPAMLLKLYVYGYDDRGERPDATPLLGSSQLPGLRPQASVHPQHRATGDSLGA